MAIKREKIQPQGIHVSMVDGKARLSLMIRKPSTDASVKLRAAGARPYRLDIGRGRLQPLVDANVASCIEFDAGGLFADKYLLDFVGDVGVFPANDARPTLNDVTRLPKRR